MKRTQSVKVVAAAGVSFAIFLMAMLGSRAAGESEESLITRGFQIAPVPLNMQGKDPALVGLGSYIVNGASDCNSCHNSGQTLDGMFVKGQDPYMMLSGAMMRQTKKVDPSTYFGGGQDFGTVDFEDSTPDDPEIISRNLTPDKTGMAEGHTFSDFLQIIRTGMDMDNVHPKLPAGFDGTRLQVMPWPTFQNMTDHDLRAIYEYLSSIPCLEGGPGEPANRCR